METNNLTKRLFNFSKDTILLLKVSRLPNEFTPIKTQLVKSATSIGANYEEAQGGISRADFKNKVYISKKEARETLYWLRILSDTKLIADLDDLINECVEINKILHIICTKTRQPLTD